MCATASAAARCLSEEFPKEDPMRTFLRYGVATLALLASTGLAAATDPSGKINPGVATQAPTGQAAPVPEVVSPRDAAEQPGQSAGSDSTGSAQSGPIGATPSTMPSTISAENAKLDKMPIMAHPLQLSSDDKRMIFESIAKNTDVETRAIDTEPANALPADVKIFDLPEKVTEQVPALKGYKYVKLTNKIVIVSAPNRIVIDEITR
jgi:hypothetical protein